VAIKVPDSVTDEHALLLAAMKCHVMALEKRGQELKSHASLCVNLDWLFGHLNSVVWFFG